MTLEKLIEEFAAAVGIAEPIAAEGVWKFSADGHVFGVAEDDSGSALWIYGEIPAPSPDREDAFRKTVLEANFFMRGTCGAVFSINPETGAYTLMKSMPLDFATKEDFFALVEKFVNTLATWKGISGATQESAGAEAPRESGPGIPFRQESAKSTEAENDDAGAFPGMLRV